MGHILRPAGRRLGLLILRNEQKSSLCSHTNLWHGHIHRQFYSSYSERLAELEDIQRRMTQVIHGMEQFTYEQILIKPDLLSFSNSVAWERTE